LKGDREVEMQFRIIRLRPDGSANELDGQTRLPCFARQNAKQLQSARVRTLFGQNLTAKRFGLCLLANAMVLACRPHRSLEQRSRIGAVKKIAGHEIH
jgi:hypothetical protein